MQDQGALFLTLCDYLLATEERAHEFLGHLTELTRWFALVRTQSAVIDLRDEVGFFERLGSEVRKVTVPRAQASPEAEQVVKQFMSEGLAAGEIIDVLGLADDDRLEFSVLSDEFLDSIAVKPDHRNVQVRLLQKLLYSEIKGRMRTNPIRAREFGQQLADVLARYEQRQISGRRSSSASLTLRSACATARGVMRISVLQPRRWRSMTRSLAGPSTSRPSPVSRISRVNS